jgi:hypothetical protein
VSDDINLAALWVPVLAETSHIKGQLAAAGAEGGAAFGQAFMGSGVFNDIEKQLGRTFGGGIPFLGAGLFKDLTGRLKDVSKASDESAESVSRASRVFNGIGITSALAFGGAIAVSAKAAGDFQASMTRLKASAGESADNLKTVGDGVLQLAGKVGYGAQDLADAMYNVEKAGFRGADGVSVLTAAAQGGKSENADLKTVLDGLTTSMHDFGFSSDQAADVMSKMVAAVSIGKTNFQDFAGSLHSVEPIAAALNISLADVYGSLAQITQSGTGASQATENMAHAMTTLSKPTQQMRDEMGQFGLNAEDVQQKLGDGPGGRGFAGTLQYLSTAIRDHMNPAGQIIVDTMFKSQQATDSATQVFNALPPAAQAVAKSIQAGTLSYAEFRKTRGGLPQEQANELQQWVGLQNKIDGYSNALKTGQGDVQTYMQALSLMVGGQDAARIALQLVADNADKTNKGIQEIDQTTREHDGTVKGFDETQTTLNAKMDDFKAAMGAARIELGTAFLPALTDVAGALADVGRFLANNKEIAEGLTFAVGGLGLAWAAVKIKNLITDFGNLLPKITLTTAATTDLATAEVAAGTAAEGLGAKAAGAATGLTGIATAAAGAASALSPLLAMLAAPELDKFLSEHGPQATRDAIQKGNQLVPGDEWYEPWQWPLWGQVGNQFDDALHGDFHGLGTPPADTGQLPAMGPSGPPSSLPGPIVNPGGPTQGPGGMLAPTDLGGLLSDAPGADISHSFGGGGGGRGISPGAFSVGGLNLSTIPVAAQKYANDCIDASARIILSHSGVNMTEDQLEGVIAPGGSIDSQAAGLNRLDPQGKFVAMQGSGGSQQAMFSAIKASIDNSTGSILNVAPGSSLAGHTFAPGHFIAATGYNPDGTINVSDTAGGKTYSVSQADAFQATQGRGIVAGTGSGPNSIPTLSGFGGGGGGGPGMGMPQGGPMGGFGLDPPPPPPAPPGGGSNFYKQSYPQWAANPDGSPRDPNVGAPQTGDGPAAPDDGGGSALPPIPNVATPALTGNYEVDSRNMQLVNSQIDILRKQADISKELADITKMQSELGSDPKVTQDKIDAAKQKVQQDQQSLSVDQERQQMDQGKPQGREGESRRSGLESDSEQFGSGFLKGLGSDMGFGNVLGGKSPLDWGITKLIGGLAGWGIGEANAWGNELGGGQSGQAGLPGMGGGGGAGGILDGVIKSMTGLNIPKMVGGVPLGPSPVAGVGLDPNTSIHGSTHGALPGPPVVNDHSINIQGNNVDPATLANMQAAQNATAGRAAPLVTQSNTGVLPLPTRN